MIVIATNNGMNYLPQLIDSLGDNEYHIIDTGSTDNDYLNYLSTLNNVHHINGGYCVGAYEYALNNIKDDWYLFLHDSMKLNDSNFLNIFQSHGEVVPWVGARSIQFDNYEQQKFIEDFYGARSPQGLVFGPIFYVTADVMKKIPIPKITNVNDMRGMERGFYSAFENLGVPINYLFEYSDFALRSDQVPIFTKYFPTRP